jgi:hypothetical protein
MCSGEGAYQTVLGIQSAGVQVGVHVSFENILTERQSILYVGFCQALHQQVR